MGMTVIGTATGLGDKLLVFVEKQNSFGVDPGRVSELIQRPTGFGSVGGFYGTNVGLVFTKKSLLALANAMEDGAELRVASCSTLDLAQARTRRDVQFLP